MVRYGVLVGVGVPVAVGVADGAAVVLVAVGVFEGAAVVPVGVALAAGADAPEALKMIGPAHKARSPVAGPVESTVRMNFTFCPANGVRSISAL